MCIWLRVAEKKGMMLVCLVKVILHHFPTTFHSVSYNDLSKNSPNSLLYYQTTKMNLAAVTRGFSDGLRRGGTRFLGPVDTGKCTAHFLLWFVMVT